MNHKHVATLAALLYVACMASTAVASPVRWTLTDVLFEDGGAASGSFIYDAAADVYSAIDITTSGGSQSGAGYASLLAGGSADALLVPPGADLTGAGVLALLFQSALTDAGGIVLLIDASFPAASSFEGSCLDAACDSVQPGRIMIDGGMIGAPVPLPGAGWLLAAAGAIAGVKAKRRSALGSPRALNAARKDRVSLAAA
jgi:hypothetical protein